MFSYFQIHIFTKGLYLNLEHCRLHKKGMRRDEVKSIVAKNIPVKQLRRLFVLDSYLIITNNMHTGPMFICLSFWQKILYS